MRTNEMRSTYVFNAPRQVWLASLGAAVVTRDWAQNEASTVFRTLVKEGTLVESRTIRIVGDRIESSVAVANRCGSARARRCATPCGRPPTPR